MGNNCHSNLMMPKTTNDYWQALRGYKRPPIHLHGVWRESQDVASNPHMCYAKSTDWGCNMGRIVKMKNNFITHKQQPAEYILKGS